MAKVSNTIEIKFDKEAIELMNSLRERIRKLTIEMQIYNENKKKEKAK